MDTTPVKAHYKNNSVILMVTVCELLIGKDLQVTVRSEQYITKRNTVAKKNPPSIRF